MRSLSTGRIRRSHLALATAIVLSCAAVACGDDDGGSTQTTAAPATTGAPATSAAPATTAAPTGPAHGGTITIGITAETDRFYPGNGNITIDARAVHSLVYGGLTAATPEGSWKPYLAESVTPNADATAWTVKLREGMKFHDGTAFDATNVKASMDRFRTVCPEGQTPDTSACSLGAANLGYVTDVVVVDPLTLEITLSKKFAVFDQVLADEFGQILSVAAVAQYGETYGDHPTGAGPYKVSEYVRDDHLTLVKNPDWPFDTNGFAETIIFRPIPDDPARAAALEAGDLDIMYTANPATILQLQGNSSFETHVEPNGALGILFSEKNIPDIEVRKAVAMAIDKDALIDTVFNGVGDAVATPFADSNFWFDANTTYPAFDPAGAQAIIEAMPAAPKLRIVSNIDEVSVNYKVAVAEMLRAVGFDIEVVDAPDGDSFVNTYITGDYDLITAGVFALIDPWFEYTRRFAEGCTDELTASGALCSFLNGTGYTNQAVTDGLIAGQESTDPAARKAGYDVVQQALANDMIQMFTVSRSIGVIHSQNIGGYGTLALPDGGGTSLANFPMFIRGDEFYRTDI